jgi:LacI family transcriptional regulator, sucrose operon repressor
MNINEIAKLAGVSRATVSRYLNDGYVSSQKKEAIKKVIDETGYEPSTQAQNLRKQVTKLIGVVIPRIQSESVSRMVSGISEVLSLQGYHLLLGNTQNKPSEELKYLKVFRKNQVDGIIFMGTVFSKEHFKLIEEAQVPIVVIGQQVNDYACVYQDDYHASYEAAIKLIKTGERVAYIGVPKKDKATGKARYLGYKDAMLSSNRKIRNDNIAEADYSINSGFEMARKLYETDNKIDSILCATDFIAVGALKYFNSIKVTVPNQIAIMGFGNTQMGEVVSPAISTVHFYYKTSGMEAAKLLMKIIDSGIDEKEEVMLGFNIIDQGSTRL